ncbi:hypothetical protein [Peribacillus sp. NPDC101480]
MNIGWDVGHSLSAGGPLSALAAPWTRHSRMSLVHPLQSTGKIIL